MKYVNRLRPSPAMVVAVLALCLSMGGIGYAAGKIGSKDLKVNAVKSRHIAGGAVTKQAIHRGAVVSVKLANSAVTTAKLGDNAVKAAKLAGTVDGLNSVNVPANDTATTTVSATTPDSCSTQSSRWLTAPTAIVSMTTRALCFFRRRCCVVARRHCPRRSRRGLPPSSNMRGIQTPVASAIS